MRDACRASRRHGRGRTGSDAGGRGDSRGVSFETPLAARGTTGGAAVVGVAETSFDHQGRDVLVFDLDDGALATEVTAVAEDLDEAGRRLAGERSKMVASDDSEAVFRLALGVYLWSVDADEAIGDVVDAESVAVVDVETCGCAQEKLDHDRTLQIRQSRKALLMGSP